MSYPSINQLNKGYNFNNYNYNVKDVPKISKKTILNRINPQKIFNWAFYIAILLVFGYAAYRVINMLLFSK